MNELERTRRIKDLAEKLAWMADDVARAEDGDTISPHVTLFLTHFKLEDEIVPELKEICKTYLVE